MDKIYTNIKNGLRVAIPYILISIGIFTLAYSVFGTFEDTRFKELMGGLGKSILIGGIFSFGLKTIQFLGVIKNELSEVMYCDPKYLSKRSDLAQLWENISKVLFKNKFPKISTAITHDVRKLYFPTDHVLYYDDYKQTVEIELIDSEKQIVKVTQYSQYIVYPKDKTSFKQETTNTIKFNDSANEVSFNITKFKINGKEELPIVSQKLDLDEKTLKTNFYFVLEGQDYYKYDTVIEKQYSLLYDNIISTKKDYLIHDFNLKIILKGDLDIQFYELGTLHQFNKITVHSASYKEFDYKGIIYPKQGYLLLIKKN